jgi:hypothetical protein
LKYSLMSVLSFSVKLEGIFSIFMVYTDICSVVFSIFDTTISNDFLFQYIINIETNTIIMK